MNRFTDLSAGRISADEAPVTGTDVVRLVDIPGLVAANMPVHTHVAASITDFAASTRSVANAWLIVSPSIGFTDGSGTRAPRVIVASGGGLTIGESGLTLDFGTGNAQAARGDHGHGQLHDAATVSGTSSITLALAGQQLSGVVRLAPNSGLEIVDDGLRVVFGTGPGEVAEGDHEDAGASHPAVTVLASSTLLLAIGEPQQLTGSVKLDGAPSGGVALGVSASGLFVPTGSTGSAAAAGNHGHPNASGSVAGFLSAADYLLLRSLEGLGLSAQLAPELLVPWTAEALPEVAGTLRGWRQWAVPVHLLVARAEATAGVVSSTTTLGLLVDGAASGVTLELPTGAEDATVTGTSDLATVYVPPNTPIRWKVESQPASLVNRHSGLDLVVNYRMDPHPRWRINVGGSALYPYLADRLVTGGSVSTTASAVNISGLVSPAPAAAYQSARARTDGGTIVCQLTGFTPGSSCVIRLHWADIGTGGAAGICVMDVAAAGATTVTLEDIDVYVLAGGALKGYILEITVAADADGAIDVTLEPAGATTRVFLNAIEALPED